MAWIDLPDLLLPSDAKRLVSHDPPIHLAELATRSLSLAAALQARRVRDVALYFDDAVELAVAILACWRACVRPVLASDIQPRTFDRLKSKVDLWLCDQRRPDGEIDLLEHEAWSHQQPLPATRLDVNAPALQILTSGSSGEAKIIDKSWPQLIAETRALQSQWPLHGSSTLTVLGSVSAQHMYGLPFRLLWPMCAGRPFVRRQVSRPEEVQELVRKHRPCVWITSPAMLRRLGDRLDWPTLRDGLQAIFSAGGPLPTATQQLVNNNLGLMITEIYGSSETGVVAWRQGDVPWTVFPGVRFGTDERQALWVESAWTGMRREQTADLATLTSAGFQLHGRLDRIIKLEEKRISLPMVEKALESHPFVDQAFVGQLPQANRLTALIALTAVGIHALCNHGRQCLCTALRKHLAKRIDPIAIPRSWRFLKQLPWNAQGKLPRLEFERLAGPRPVMPLIHCLPRQAEDAVTCTLDVPLDLAYFSGHFPSLPVVPGVAQIGWVCNIAREYLRPDLRVAGIDALKFRRLLRPGDQALLTMRWDASAQRLHFTISLAGQPCSSGRIQHRGDHAAV